MKNKLLVASVIAISALSHLGPAIGLILIAVGEEITRALGATLLLVSSLSMGYLHGLNRTHEILNLDQKY